MRHSTGTPILIFINRYYAFVANIVFRKIEWVKTACFAATMLFPAVAALHGIVLAAVNVKGKLFPGYCQPSYYLLH